MIAAVEAGQKLAINWPLAWYRSHNTAKRLVDEGAHRRPDRGPLLRRQPRAALPRRRQGRGERRGGRAAEAGELVLQEGRRRRQPARLPRLRHDARHLVPRRRASRSRSPRWSTRRRASRWTSIRSPSRATRRGCRKFETRWGTFTDPWIMQPQPKCGFILVGTKGAVSSYDYDDHVTLQLRGGDPTRCPATASPRSGAAPSPTWSTASGATSRSMARFARDVAARPAHDRHRPRLRRSQAHAGPGALTALSHPARVVFTAGGCWPYRPPRFQRGEPPCNSAS